MISWWWVIILLIVAGFMGVLIGMYYGQCNTYDNFRKLELTPTDIQLSEARLESLWLSKQLENITQVPSIPFDICIAERWRKDANKWAQKVIKERIREKAK